MTQQEFVIAESEKYVDNSKPVERDECSWQIVDESFTDGLTKGLEIAEEIIQQLTGEDKERSKLLLNKFLTQKYEK